MTELPNQTGEILLEGGRLDYVPSFLSRDQEMALFQRLINEIDWKSEEVRVYGKVYPQPRLTSFFSRIPGRYTYSGLSMESEPFPASVRELLDGINEEYGLTLNCCLANLYRNGTDSNGWHSDDEPELGPDPLIASVSLGAPRYFHLRRRANPSETYKLLLEPGSLLLMLPPMQRNWQHQLPKTAKSTPPRINLTFRQLTT